MDSSSAGSSKKVAGAGEAKPSRGDRRRSYFGVANGGKGNDNFTGFQMPLHYPSFSKSDYENMPEWQLDRLLSEYGLPSSAGDVEQKRKFAIGAFLWAPQR